MATVLEVAEALADALTDLSPNEPVNVSPFMEFAPDVPAIDIWPADPSEEDLAFGPESVTLWFVVRLRTATSDREGVQELLYAARDQTGPRSVRGALMYDTTLGGLVDNLHIRRPSGFQLYEDSLGSGMVRFLGEEWRVGVMTSSAS